MTPYLKKRQYPERENIMGKSIKIKIFICKYVFGPFWIDSDQNNSFFLGHFQPKMIKNRWFLRFLVEKKLKNFLLWFSTLYCRSFELSYTCAPLKIAEMSKSSTDSQISKSIPPAATSYGFYDSGLTMHKNWNQR